METSAEIVQSTPEQRNAWTLDALNHLDQGITVFDHELRLVAWNQRWYELLDFPKELAIVNQPIEVLFRFNAERGEYGEGDIEQQVAERVALARQFRSHVFERIRPDGTIIEVRGNPMANGGFVTTYTDVTEQRQAEARLEMRVKKRTEELRNSELWIRQIADAVPALIAYVDRENRYRFINHMHQQWFGLDREELLGTSIFDLVEHRNLVKFQEDIKRVQQGEEVQSEYRLRRRNREPLDVSISFIPHFDEQGIMLGYFFLGQDLTEHKQTQRELAESHKMQALGLLTGGVAHDFNNLLTIILGNLNFLEEEGVDEQEMREVVQACREAAKRGGNLIQRLLTFSRRQALKPELTNVNLLVDDFSRLLQRTLGENIRIDCQFQDNPGLIRVDRNQLETCLLNLALNARDAMSMGGKLLIQTQHYKINGRGVFGSLPSKEPYLMLSVADTGQGMNTETISRVFEPFFTTKPAGHGTGLGLSMVYGFVKQSGGGIDIESELGEGTTVRLVFPVEQGTIAGNALDVQESQDISQAARILLVEDDQGVRRFIQRSLHKLGYQVELAENGELALEKLQLNAVYDLVLTDIVMPGTVSGLDIYQRIQQDYPETRVLCMTGYSDQLDDNLDEANLLLKPFEPSQLNHKLQELLTGTHVGISL